MMLFPWLVVHWFFLLVFHKNFFFGFAGDEESLSDDQAKGVCGDLKNYFFFW
jgi:hypothetical protein